MTRKKTHLLRNCIIIMLLFGIGGLILTYTQYFGNPNPTAATATIEFTFEGAADGLAPNGTLFNLSGITSEDVLAPALKECGLEETYTVEQLQKNLVARGVYPDNYTSMVSSYDSLLNFTTNHEARISNYHATTYSVELYNDFDKTISKNQLETLLKAIVSSYKAYFAKAYANGLSRDDLAQLSNYDYPQQLDIMETYFNTMSAYAQEMYARRPAFIYEGEGFNDINVRLDSLVNSDIARLKADMTLNAVTRESDRLKSQYTFEISDLQNQQNSQKACLAQLEALINSYEKNGVVYVNSGDNVTKIENNTGATYDTLVSQRKDVSDNIATIGAQIVTYQQLLADLTDGAESELQTDSEAFDADGEAAVALTESERASMSAAQSAALESSIDALVTKSNAVMDDFEVMLKAFNQQEINDQTVTVTKYRYVAPQVLSSAFVVAAIKTAGPICAIGFMLCLIMIIHIRKREMKLSLSA